MTLSAVAMLGVDRDTAVWSLAGSTGVLPFLSYRLLNPANGSVGGVGMGKIGPIRWKVRSLCRTCVLPRGRRVRSTTCFNCCCAVLSPPVLCELSTSPASQPPSRALRYPGLESGRLMVAI
jgi:hypothetical protein